MALLDIRNLSIDIMTSQGKRRIVDKASLTINEGSIHGLIGESGSGKSLIAKAILGIHQDTWIITADRMYLGETDLTKLSGNERRKIMGNEISMIFQQPKSYLDPTKKIYYQVKEALSDTSISDRLMHTIKYQKKSSTRKRIKELFHRVGIQNDQTIMSSYPHELSEGICQKVMIAMAIVNNPRILIADEPTIAMDDDTQAQIFRLLYKLNQLHKTTILLLSNSFASIRDIADQITLIYSGQTVESGTYKQITEKPLHPYTQAMIKTIVAFDEGIEHKSPLYTLPGNLPSSSEIPIGCRLGPRCPIAQKKCVTNPEQVNYKGHLIRCHFSRLEQGKYANTSKRK